MKLLFQDKSTYIAFILSNSEKNWMGTVSKLRIVRTLSGWPTRGYSSDPTPAARSAPTRTIHPRSARLAGSQAAVQLARKIDACSASRA